MTVRTEGGPPRDDADDRTEGPDHEDQDGNREEPDTRLLRVGDAGFEPATSAV